MDESILNEARSEAFNEALRRPNSLEALVEKSLGMQTAKSLESTKSKLRAHRKERMRTCQFYLCDLCDKTIHDPEDGFVVHGNIYVADPNCRGGLVGNNFPEVELGNKIDVMDVKEEVLCMSCFIQACGLDKKYSLKEQVPGSSPAMMAVQNHNRRLVRDPAIVQQRMELEPMEEIPVEAIRRRQSQQQSDHASRSEMADNFIPHESLEGSRHTRVSSPIQDDTFNDILNRPPRRR